MHPLPGFTYPKNTEITYSGWNDFGLTKRMMDVVNQCKYLASKKGLNLKELRRSMREDEARQRLLFRQKELEKQQRIWQMNLAQNSSMASQYYVTKAYPLWTNDGTIYSQFNRDGYGMEPERINDSRLSSPPPPSQFHPPHQEISLNNKVSNEDLVNLLYSAGARDKIVAATPPTLVKTVVVPAPMKMGDPLSPRMPPSRVGGASGIILEAEAKNKAYSASQNSLESRDSAESLQESSLDDSIIDLSRINNRPVRKLASHDLTTLMKTNSNKSGQRETTKTKGRDEASSLSFIMMTSADEFSSTSEDEEDKYTENDMMMAEQVDSTADDFNYSTESNDKNVVTPDQDQKRVVSPLLKKVESAFADLHKNDSLFGNEDDFGHLMKRIL